MTEREQKIRKLVETLAAADSGVSREYPLLSVDAAEFLLMELDNRLPLPAGFVVLTDLEVDEVKALLRGDLSLPREAAGVDFPLSEGLLAKFK